MVRRDCGHWKNEISGKKSGAMGCMEHCIVSPSFVDRPTKACDCVKTTPSLDLFQLGGVKGCSSQVLPESLHSPDTI